MELIIIILGALALIVFSPFLSFACGWLIGWLIKIVFGATLVTGLKLLNINIDVGSIPLLCGTLNVIGMFFRNVSMRSSKSDD